jgi:2-methylcitrate dehydratase PrpD
LVRAARGFTDLSPAVIAKVKIALLDFLSCAYESLDLPPSRQALLQPRPRSPTQCWAMD